MVSPWGKLSSKSIIDLQLTWNKSVGLGIIGPGAKPDHIEPRLEPHARVLRLLPSLQCLIPERWIIGSAPAEG